MLRVGLTGGVACGKTTVARMFAQRGARVVYADEIARELMQPGQAVYDDVVHSFGRGILEPEGPINRARLAQLVFDPKRPRVEELNRIVHPAVIARQEEWMAEVERREPDAVAMVEAALILEAGVRDRFDRIVVVTCIPEQKAERFARRTSMEQDLAAARAEVERRSAAQISDAEKARSADFVIDNSGALEATEAQVERVWAELKQLAESGHGGTETRR